ncbi:ABC transporter ATP-binding protein [Tardiphaga alba]|uniref:ABC transporter ATP-binding protein n=1 Tax=Tardiphaga alba TaxID=340268 RepID=A0ABX8A9U4_9BRAD|nr:ABC transporter ATP-binding protein [Tardiphaga alba]
MSELLAITDLRAGYGEAVVIPKMTLSLGEGQVLALLGRNGTGKTTLINSIVGVTRRFSGTVKVGARDFTTLRADQRARGGIGWVPQERNIFRSLTVEENMTAVAQPGEWTVNKVYEMFPRLEERKNNFGNQLSGGEQQMLAVGRALVLNPKVLLLDEPTEGLAPIIVEELLSAIGKISRTGGICSIIVEQNARKILGLADRVVILERGTIVHDAASETLKADPSVLDHFLGVAGAAGTRTNINLPTDHLGVSHAENQSPVPRRRSRQPSASGLHQGSARQAGKGRNQRR